MKLNAPQLSKVEEQLGVEALPDDNPAMPKLQEVFGEHTFFLDANGLNTVEPNPSPESPNANVVKLANWSEDQTQLQVVEPEVLPVAVDLGTDDPSSAA